MNATTENGQAAPPAECNAVLALSPPLEDRTQVLKYGDTFAVLDRFGDIRDSGLGEEGVFHFGCRQLSRFVLELEGSRLLMLGSAVHDDNAILSVDLTNPDIPRDEETLLAKDTLHVRRTSFLHRGEFLTRFDLHNYSLLPIEFRLSLTFDADFIDLFEVRGVHRVRRGRRAAAEVSGDRRVDIDYEGLDGNRRTTILFDPPPTEIAPNQACYALRLGPNECASLDAIASFGGHDEAPAPFEKRLSQATTEHSRWRKDDPTLRSSNEHFNAWITRSASDLHLMITETEHGLYPYAGVPWFSTPFGRDGLITSLMCLWMNPRPARGVLRYLAKTQAEKVEPDQDAEPGKILHEARHGEMAALDEIPFRRYYGSVDSTPLFIILAEAYWRRTADREMLHELWPHVERALQWIDDYGDQDGDGFIEYQRQARVGIYSQGWKDSDDAIFHADGRLAEPPIAVCEAQGYVYAARRAAARMARALGRDPESDALLNEAGRMQERFDKAFWSEELQSYALALDAQKRPCLVRASNAGHCLFSGIARPERARAVAVALTNDASFSGWGVRTVAEGEARYNPMSYHNGSVWPHDNAIIAEGLARYNFKSECLRLFEGMFGLSMSLDLNRLPELLCGFPRRAGAGPTLYPVACSPQAWASAAVFMMIRAALGLQIDATEKKLLFKRPQLPTSIRRLTIERLSVAGSEIDLEIQRHREDVGINVLRRSGDLRVSIMK